MSIISCAFFLMSKLMLDAMIRFTMVLGTKDMEAHSKTIQSHGARTHTHTHTHTHKHCRMQQLLQTLASDSFFFGFSGASALLCWKAHKGGIYTHEWIVLGDMYATNEEEMMADGRLHRMEREDAWMGTAVGGSVDRRKGKIGGKIPSANMEARA